MARHVESPRFKVVKLVENKDSGNSGDRLSFSITLSYLGTKDNLNNESGK
jgi:hypothetical protein